MRKSDLHSDEFFCQRRDDVAERREQLAGVNDVELVFRSIYDRFPEYLELFQSRADARKAYEQTINGILDRAKQVQEPQIVRAEKDLDIPGLKTILHIEGLNTVTSQEELQRLTDLWQRGVRSIGPIYAHEETLGGGNSADKNIGLQPLGEQVLLRAVQLGMGIDLAHCNRKTKDDILNFLAKNESGSVAFTHGSLFNGNKKLRQRTIEESQAKEIIKRGGIIGISVTKPFVSSADDAVEQIMTVAEMSDFNGVGIGTDFGGMPNSDLLDGMRSYEELYDTLCTKLTNNRGLNDAELSKIFGENAFTYVRRMLAEKRSENK